MPGLAVMAITGYRTLGTQASTPNTSDSQTRQIVDDMNWIRGKHTLKLGANISFIQAPSRQVYRPTVT